MPRLPRWLLCLFLLALTLAPAPRPTVAAAPAPGNPCATQPGSYKVLADRAGIYEITRADLAAAGWSGQVDLGRLHLYHGACVAANQVALDRAADSVRFYGAPSTSRYSASTTYWLRQESALGLNMNSRPVAPGGAQLQATALVTAVGVLSRPPLYDTVFPGDDGDHFFAADIRGGVTVPVTFTLSNPVAGPAELRLALQGVSSGAHALRVTFDGVDRGVQAWDGATTSTAVVSLGTAALAAGAHVLKLDIAGAALNTPAPEDTALLVDRRRMLRLSAPAATIDVVELDRAELRHPAQLRAAPGQTRFDGVAGARRYSVGGFTAATALLYDVRDAPLPARLTGASVGATVDWQDAPAQPGRYALLAPGQTLRPTIIADTPSNLAQGSADYLIVGYRPFLPATTPLADYYRARGLRVATVDVQDAYDEFNGGAPDPEALRGFLRHAYAAWARPAPTYLLLVGDGSYDFRDLIGMGAEWTGFLPPYLADVDPWMREAACDTCYGRLQTDDPRDQQLPDLLVGRLPVDSVEQASTVISKTLGYLTSPPPGGWRMTSLFLVDNYLDASGQPDPAGDFWSLADNTVAALPRGMAVDRFIYDPSPAGAGKPARYATPGPLREDMFKAFDGGAALVTYVGHANFWQWGYTSANATTPYLWYLYDADGRSNGGRLPVLLALTCLTGYYHEPLLQTTDERLLTWPNGGTVASFSPAGKGVALGHDVFARGALGALYSGDPNRRATRCCGPTLGAAQRAGFQALLDSGENIDLTFTYAVFGDPALHLPFVPTRWSFLPVARR